MLSSLELVELPDNSARQLVGPGLARNALFRYFSEPFPS